MATISWARSLLFSYIEGQHLPHFDYLRIKQALEILNATDPYAARTLERFHVQGEKWDTAGEAEAARRLAEVLETLSSRVQAA